MTEQQQPTLTQQLAAALPAHAHHGRTGDFLGFGGTWKARWTTPTGLWTITHEPGLPTSILTIHGPDITIRLGHPTAEAVTAQLRLLGALAPEPADWDAADLLSEAWGIIANASDGDWNAQPDHWREAAQRWRDHYHQWLNHRDHTTRPVAADGSRAPATAWRTHTGATYTHPTQIPCYVIANRDLVDEHGDPVGEEHPTLLAEIRRRGRTYRNHAYGVGHPQRVPVFGCNHEEPTTADAEEASSDG